MGWRSRWHRVKRIPKKVSSSQRDLLDRPVTADELERSLKALPNNKTPGRDGFTKEFFVWGWAFIHPILMEALAQVWEQGSLGRILNESLITLIPKPQAEESIQNWRPISLLTTISKIVMKAMARRIGPFMDCWVSLEQRGFVSGRCILDNILWLKEAKWWVNHKKIPTVFLSLVC